MRKHAGMDLLISPQDREALQPLLAQLKKRGLPVSEGSGAAGKDDIVLAVLSEAFYKDKDLQVIWGYLQIGEIIDDPTEQSRLWWHPHSSEERRNNKTNIIYKASRTLSFDESKPGAGILPFRLDRVLTAKNCNKATWKKSPVYDVQNIMGNRKNSAKDPETGIYYAGIWQELCLAETEECSDWARSLILTNRL